MVIRARSTNAAPRSNLAHFLPAWSLHGSLASSPFSLFFFFNNEIYRWVKIGLWIWFITTKLFGWISLPRCPWFLSGEPHLASSHQPPRLSLSVFPSVFFMVLWRRANFSQFLKSTLLRFEMGLQRGHKGGRFCSMRCYSMSQHLWDPLCLATNIFNLPVFRMSTNNFHIMPLPTSIGKVINKAWTGSYCRTLLL